MKKSILVIICLLFISILFSCSTENENTHKVIFDTDGGSYIRSQIVEDGKYVSIPSNPIKENYIFLYWMHNGAEFDFNTPITANITLVAKWEEVLPHMHSYVKEIIEPTCIESGYTLYSCVCGDSYKEDIVASLDHDQVIHDKKDPTCTEVGWDTYITCNNCDYSTYKELPALNHDEVYHEGKEPTCEENGYYDYVTCTRCSYTTYEEIEPLGHDEVYHDAKEPTETEIGWEAYITCNRCTYSTYKELPATGNTSIEIYEKDGKKFINFGSYPQTHVNDTELINELNKLTTVNSRGYYEYNGFEYAKVTTKPWLYGSSDYTYSTGKTVEYGVTEWFKVEPIVWRILSTSNKTYQVLSEYILDESCFYHDLDEVRTIDGQTIYPNNYKYSDIREFLNNAFLNAAFKTNEQSLIIVSEVDNSICSTDTTNNSYVCENTLDKIYLLSYQDSINPGYGFSSYYENDEDRRAVVTDYAKAMGVWWATSSTYYNMGYWWLRSPYHYDSNYASVVGSNGFVYYYDYYVDYSHYGVRPAFAIAKS